MSRKLDRLWYIAHVRSYFPSTYANNFQIMQMCSAFSSRGIETTLLVPKRLAGRSSNMVQASNLWAFYNVSPSFRIAWLPFPYPFARAQRAAHACLVGLYCLPRRVSLAYTRSEWVSSVLTRLGMPTVLELHHISPGITEKLIVGIAAKPNFLRLVCISQAMGDRLVAAGFPPAKLIVAHDGVDLARFKPRLTQAEARAQVGLPADARIVCHVGHMYPGRGIETILEAAGWLPDVTFVLVGGRREELAFYREELARRRLGNVQLVGFVPHAKVPVYLYAADVLAMPYTAQTATHTYMSPMKMFEYMAAGRPIVASYFPVIEEILEQDRNVLYYPPDDAATMAAAIRRLTDDPDLAQALGERAQEDVKVYTWEARADRILRAVADARLSATTHEGGL